MKALTAILALSIGLLAVPALAQTTQQTPPAKPPATQTPPATAAQKPAPAAQPATPPAAPRPFPEGAKIAYFSPQLVLQGSIEGKTLLARSQALREKKTRELQDKNAAMEANQKKAASPTIDDAARVALEREIARQNTEIQRMTQDAQNEVQEAENDLREAFTKKLDPIVEAVAKEKGLHILLVREANAMYWADQGLDLTQEIVRRLDIAATTPAKKAPAADPAAQR